MGRGFFDDDTFFAKPGVAAPTVDVSEDKKGYHIEAELPGVDESNVEVTVRDNRLSLRGEKKSEKEKEGQERSHVGAPIWFVRKDISASGRCRLGQDQS